MKLRIFIAAVLAVALSCGQANAQATLLPNAEQCFQAVTGITGMLGTLGTITGGTGGTAGSYGGVTVTGGTGSGATANVTVAAGSVTGFTILNPGVGFTVGDVLSVASANIGNVTGFSIPVLSVSINSAVAGGSVSFFIPNTTTPKQTWQDSGETILNQNPTPLDSNGCLIAYGSGVYRQILKDSLGNTIWDRLTASTGPTSIFWAGLATGTGNAISIIDSSFTNQDGAVIQFLAKAANTGPTTIAVSGGTPIAIVNDLSTGPAALSGGEIGPGNTPMLTYDATNVEFHIVNPSASSSGSGSSSNLTPPQGYLNLIGQATGDVVQTGDVIAAITVFYSPFVGNTLPIWNGSVFKSVTFSELTTTLTAAGSTSNVIQDECVFSNNGVPTLVTAPAWTTATAGAGNRGTGAGSAQITRLQGIWVNAVSIIGYNGLSSFTIPANQCTYVGSLSIDSTAGQVTAHRTYGQSRKFGVWNAYNRQPIYLKAGDATSTWSPSGTLGPVRGQTANSLTIFTGLPEEIYDLRFQQRASATQAATNQITLVSGIGFNSTTVASGYQANAAVGVVSSTFTFIATNNAQYTAPPSLGINVITALESGITITAAGGETGNLLSALWRG